MQFPRTMVGGVSLPRLICGTNWFLGYSHTTAAKNRIILELFDKPSKMADVLEVFVRNGCDATMAPLSDFVIEAIRETEQRTGLPVTYICTPSYTDPKNPDSWKEAVDKTKKAGATFCFPHESVTDPRVDRINKCFHPQLIQHLKYVREMEMIPGLSTHMPESVVYADETEADVETYIQPYNALGFMCQVETDWIQRIIQNARKPVMTIKPLAAGRLHPQTGLPFVWSTIRECDMVTIGTMSAYEAEEVIEISLSCLENRKADIQLQATRSKGSILQKL